MQIVCAIRPSGRPPGDPSIRRSMVHCPAWENQFSNPLNDQQQIDRGPSESVRGHATAAVPLLFNGEGKPVSSYYIAGPSATYDPVSAAHYLISCRPVQSVWPKCKFTYPRRRRFIRPKLNQPVGYCYRPPLSCRWENWFWQLGWDSVDCTHNT